MIEHTDSADSRWILQTEFADSQSGIIGNCLQAAVASLLNMRLEDVPHFYEISPDAPSAALGAFLHSRGYYLIALSDTPFRPLGLYLGGGPAVRGVHHVVVMQGETMVHDPHPSNAGLIEMTDVLLIVPVDPVLRQTAVVKTGASVDHDVRNRAA